MERVYYSINETLARKANWMMPFSNYKKGSKTAEYKGYVDRAYELADKIALVRPDQADQVYSMAAEYSKRMAEYTNRDIHIGCMCPSVMIFGAGNFPVRKKVKQNQTWNKNHKFFNETQGILSRMESILHGKELIKSSDENAIEKLEEKLESLKDMQERMKVANKAIRLKDMEKGNEQLRIMGYSEKQIKKLRDPAGDVSEGVEAMHAARELGKSINPLFDLETYMEVTLVVDGSRWNPNETEKKVYEGLKRNESWLASDLVASYCDNNGISRGVIKGLDIRHYGHGTNGGNGGHFIVTAYVGKKIMNEK